MTKRHLKLRLRQAKLWTLYILRRYQILWDLISSQQLAFTASIFLATYGLALLWSAHH